MTRSSAGLVLAVLCAAGVAAFLLPLVSPAIDYPKFDEYIVVYDAQRVLNGAVPYRDFFNFIPPGTFYLLAALFAPFGKASLTVSRYAALAVAILNWLLLWTALKRARWDRPRALLLSLLYPVCLYPFWPVISHHWLVHTACMGFLWLVAGIGERVGPGQAFALGLLAGTAGAFLQTEMLYLAVVGAVLVVLKEGWREGARKEGLLGAGMLLPLGALFLPLVISGAGSGMVRDLITWPARNYSRAGNDNARFLLDDVPIRLDALWSTVHGPGSVAGKLLLALAGTALYVLLLAGVAATVVAACWVLGRTLRRRAAPAPLFLAACLLTFLSLGLFLRGRPDWLRLIYLMGFLGGLWLVAAGGLRAAGKRVKKGVVLWAALTLAVGLVYQSRWMWTHWPTAAELCDVDRPIRESPVNRWLRSPGVLQPGDTVAAFPEGGEVYLYSCRPALGYTYFMPLSDGYNSARDHAIAAKEIRENRAKWILMTPETEQAYLDPASPVGRLIRDGYHRVGAGGGVVRYERN